MEVRGPDLGAGLGASGVAPKTAASWRTANDGLRLYGIAMAIGRAGLDGFAPVARAAARRMVRAVTPKGEEAGKVPTGPSDARESDVRAAHGDEAAGTGYRATMARARAEAAVMAARRSAERAALLLPARHAAIGWPSFAPQPSHAAEDGGLRDSDRQVEVPPSALGRRAGRMDGETWQAPGSTRSLGRAVAHEGGVAASWRAAAGLPDSSQRDSLQSRSTAVEVGFLPQGETGERHFANSAPPAAALSASREIERALDEYFFRLSRMPPAGGAGFNPLLSPVWAGLKIPG